MSRQGDAVIRTHREACSCLCADQTVYSCCCGMQKILLGYLLLQSVMCSILPRGSGLCHAITCEAMPWESRVFCPTLDSNAGPVASRSLSLTCKECPPQRAKCWHQTCPNPWGHSRGSALANVLHSAAIRVCPLAGSHNHPLRLRAPFQRRCCHPHRLRPLGLRLTW